VAEIAGSNSGDGSKEFEGGRDLDRVVFFSDAVFAIAMTVLALTLSLPAGTTDAGVAHALDKAIPSIFAYALSFVVIAMYWLAHHRMFHYIRRLDATLLVLNLASLGAIAFIPFPASVLGDHGNTTAAVVFYAATMGILGTLFSVFWMYATHHRRFIQADTPPRFVKHALWRAISIPAVFVASIPIAFADPNAAEWFWLAAFVGSRLVLRRLYGSIYKP
jgi:uncharacterized membrane protein